MVLIHNELKEYGEMKEEIKNVNNYLSLGLRSRQFIEDFSIFIKQCYHIVESVDKNTESKNPNIVTTKNGRIMLL